MPLPRLLSAAVLCALAAGVGCSRTRIDTNPPPHYVAPVVLDADAPPGTYAPVERDAAIALAAATADSPVPTNQKRHDARQRGTEWRQLTSSWSPRFALIRSRRKFSSKWRTFNCEPARTLSWLLGYFGGRLSNRARRTSPHASTENSFVNLDARTKHWHG